MQNGTGLIFSSHHHDGIAEGYLSSFPLTEKRLGRGSVLRRMTVLEEISVLWYRNNQICKLHNGSPKLCVKSRNSGIGWSWGCIWFCCILQCFVLAYWSCEMEQVNYLSLASNGLIVKWREYF